MSHLATVSRDLRCHKFSQERLAAALTIQAAEKVLLKAKRRTIGSALFEHDPLRPQGKPWGQQEVRGGGNSDCHEDEEAKARKQFMDEHGNELRRQNQEAVRAAESHLEDVRKENGGLPVTRDELSAWVSTNIVEIREKMTTAPARRRQLNNRVWARAGQPSRRDIRITPAGQRRAEPAGQRRAEAPNTDWTKLLVGRTGWHGILTKTGFRMFWLQRHRGTPYIVDLEAWRKPDGYFISKDFDLLEHLKPLSSLALFHARQVLRLRVVDSASPEPHGVYLQIDKYQKVTQPLRQRKAKGQTHGETDDLGSDSAENLDDHGEALRPTKTKGETKGESDDFGSDSAENLDDHLGDSDVQSSECAVEVCSDDSGKADKTSDDDDDDAEPVKDWEDDHLTLAHLLPIAEASHRLAGARGSVGHGRNQGLPKIYQNSCFNIIQRTDYPAITCLVKPEWYGDPPKGMGRTLKVSKTISPHLLTETLAHPTRTMLCLRAWMLWRARTVGFATSIPRWQALFDEIARSLTRDLAGLGPQHDGCLGHPLASKLFKVWAPDELAAAERLR